MADQVENILTGLEHGEYYYVYVTQKNNAGIESAKGTPAIIRVGDCSAPPTTVLSLDTSYGTGGYLADSGLTNVGLKWTSPGASDIRYFAIYQWDLTNYQNFFTGDGLYDSSMISLHNGVAWSGGVIDDDALSTVLMGLATAVDTVIGIQVVDFSHNKSAIYCIHIKPEDTSVLQAPTVPLVATAGVWKIILSTTCPASTQNAYLLFYRDNEEDSCGAIPYVSGQAVEFTDLLDVDKGVTHFYTYAYYTKNGYTSARSAASNTVTALFMDTRMLDEASLKALNDAWRTEDGTDINQLKADLLAQQELIASHAAQLATVTENYSALYNNYSILANRYEVISSGLDDFTEGVTASLETSTTQTKEYIEQRAVKIETDLAGQIEEAYVAAIKVEADRISQVVADLEGKNSQITMLAGQMQLKVGTQDVCSAINMSPETIMLSAKHVAVNADMIVNGAIRAKHLYLEDIFPQSSNENGYLVFPGGVYMQWGRVYISEDTVDREWPMTFPHVFPNRCFNVVAVLQNVNSNWVWDYVVQILSYDNSTCRFYVNRMSNWENAQGNYIHWIAFGC